jgi:MFS family permease
MDVIEPPPSRSSLLGLDAVNLFLAGALSGFGPYVALFLAEQKWTQQNIGFVLTAGGLAGLLSQLPGGELLDAIRSKRLVVALGAMMVAASAFIIALRPSFPLVLAALVLQAITGGFLGLAVAAISLGLVGHAALGKRLGRNQRFAWTGGVIAGQAAATHSTHLTSSRTVAEKIVDYIAGRCFRYDHRRGHSGGGKHIHRHLRRNRTGANSRHH